MLLHSDSHPILKGIGLQSAWIGPGIAGGESGRYLAKG